MTACAYIRPPSDPDDTDPDRAVMAVLIADSLASPHGVTPVPILPASTRFDDLELPYNTELFRKIFLFGDTAAAFAGSASTIAEVVEHLPSLLPEWVERSPDHAMEHFHDMLMEVQALRGGNSVRGFAVRGSGGRTSYGGSGTRSIELRHYGVCYATGSGAEDLLTFIADHEVALERAIQNRARRGAAPFTVEEKVESLINTLNGRKLVRELSVGSENAWGGYIEHARFEEGHWTLGGNVLHVIYDWQDVPDERFELNGLRLVAYSPNVLDGSIVTTTPEDGWVLFNLSHLDRPPRLADLGAWRGWEPDQIYITVRYNGHPDRLVFMKMDDEMRNLHHFRVMEDEGTGMGVDAGFEAGFPERLSLSIQRHVHAMVTNE